MGDAVHADGSVDEAAARLAWLLMSSGGGLRDPSGSNLVFDAGLVLRPLGRTDPPLDVWAVDGGQALVADARCLQVYVTRAARVRWREGRTEVEDEGILRAHLLGLGEERRALADLGSPVDPDAAVDVNLLRDWGEWAAVSASIDECEPGGVVLVDGDLQPDWRIPSSWLGELLERASSRQVLVVGVTKHTSLSWGGAPLLAVLERQAEMQFGERGCWWAHVARTRPDVKPGIEVVVARMDPDARFAFRVDVPGSAAIEEVLTRLSALCDDAAFPGYPYPLTVADRLASCPSWVKDEVWNRLAESMDQAGVPFDVRERAFSDRHRMMERA